MIGTKLRVMTCSMIAGLVGCSDLAGEDTAAQPLASLIGNLTIAEGMTLPEAPLRVALLWEVPDGRPPTTPGTCKDGAPFLQGQQQATFSPSFPSQFVLDLDTPPPLEALYTPPGTDVQFATARVVVYSDGDDDGKLDSSAPGRPSPDIVLGWSDVSPRFWGDAVHGDVLHDRVVYVTAPHEYDDRGVRYAYPAGFSLQRTSRTDPSTFSILPLSTVLELQLTAEPPLQDLLCEELCRPVEFLPAAIECPASLTDLPAPPAGSKQVSSEHYDAGWAWAPANDSYGTQTTSCLNPDTFVFTLSTSVACQKRHSTCSYERANAPATVWPCN